MREKMKKISDSKVGTYVKTKQLQVPVQERWISKRRHLLLLQVLRVFFDRNRRVDKECLRIIWRALPDSFFTSDQLMFTYEKIPHPMRVSLQAFYQDIVDGDISDSKPRSLQHYSRVAIRRTLCRNKMLPEGIPQLGLAQAHQAYLRLEK
ncbi:hypothetical protein AVEN_221076-1 [Araneus ventricosus]|uniref:SOCS box domain-containing protein n=1 Tax=Araneus ventricosus TaxID=182803 RepID=A0A4Y2QYP2_ARAVE|nr:hypothetical protein AVEN_221076-1 [Araneus ventricosus]